VIFLKIMKFTSIDSKVYQKINLSLEIYMSLNTISKHRTGIDTNHFPRNTREPREIYNLIFYDFLRADIMCFNL
jgi:hypothetical protein